MTSIVDQLRQRDGDWLCEKAADEIERLLVALESLTKDPPATFAREPDTDDEVIIKMRAIARAALDNTQ